MSDSSKRQIELSWVVAELEPFVNVEEQKEEEEEGKKKKKKWAESKTQRRGSFENR